MQLRTLALVAALAAFLAAPAAAQTTTGTACVSSNTPSAVAFGRTQITFTSADHGANDPNGNPKITDYFGEVRVKGQTPLVTNFTVPKSSVSAITGATAGCLGTLLPAMQGLLSTNTYTLTWFARGPGGTAVSATAADFFLQGAPAAPANTALVTPGS